MAVTYSPITIVGCGPGSPNYLTDIARQAVADAEALLGSRRLLDMFPAHPGLKTVWHSDSASLMEEIGRLRETGKRVAVLVSGDPGLCSLARKVVVRFGLEAVAIVPGISSVQVAFARLGLDWADARILSAHGRKPDVAPAEVSRWNKIAVLAGTREALRWSASAARSTDQSHAVYLCENLTLDDERLRPMDAAALDAVEAASLAIVLFVRRNLVT